MTFPSCKGATTTSTLHTMATIRAATGATRATSRILATARPQVARARAVVPAVRQLNTINQDEISHFSRLSQHWWDEAGEFALLHRMNPERVEYIRQKVALDPRTEPEWTFEGRHGDRAREEARGAGRWLEGKRCLDVGCGGGLLAEVGCSCQMCRE